MGAPDEAPPCLAAYEPGYDESTLAGEWARPPCEGETAETCVVDSVDVNGEPRCFVVSVPPAGASDLPILFDWHGSGGSGAAERRTMNGELEGLALEAAIDGRALVVYPDGRPHPDCNGNTCWDRAPDGADVAFFDALLQALPARWPADPSRVFSLGHSRGGRFVEVLACHRAGSHRALASMAAGTGNVTACPGRAPMWLSHGLDDETIPFAQGVEHLRAWADRNGCPSPDPDAFPPDACTPVPGCEVPLTWCPTTVEAWGGHAPPPLADEELWAFLSSAE